VLLAVSFILDLKAFYGYIASVLLSGAGVSFLFRGIIKKIKPAILPKELVKI